jgi:hypothetical protein
MSNCLDCGTPYQEGMFDTCEECNEWFCEECVAKNNTVYKMILITGCCEQCTDAIKEEIDDREAEEKLERLQNNK